MLRAIQERADLQGLGVSIRAVRLGRVAPPVPVAPAFADAARARSDRRQAVTRAEEYRDRAQADARGQAREIADRAAGQFDRLVQVARGEADRFTKVLAESRKDLDATRRRLYLEALAELLPRFPRKVVVAPGQDLDLSLFTEARARQGRPTEARGGPESRVTPSDDETDRRGGADGRPDGRAALVGSATAVGRRRRGRAGGRPGRTDAPDPAEARLGSAARDAWRGDVAGYLDASPGRSASGSSARWTSAGRDAFAADLRRAARSRKSHAVFAVEPEGDDAARITVETVYPDRNERQTYRLDRGRRRLARHRGRDRPQPGQPEGQVRHPGARTRSPKGSPSRAPARSRPADETVRAEDPTVDASTDPSKELLDRCECDTDPLAVGLTLLGVLGVSVVCGPGRAGSGQDAGARPLDPDVVAVRLLLGVGDRQVAGLGRAGQARQGGGRSASRATASARGTGRPAATLEGQEPRRSARSPPRRPQPKAAAKAVAEGERAEHRPGPRSRRTAWSSRSRPRPTRR